MLCLTAAGLALSLPITAFTLAWEHTVERTEWQEDYRISSAGLILSEARIRGHGAGMEPGENARLEGGWWRWRPDRAPVPELILARSGVGEWRLCWAAAGCNELAVLLPGMAPVTMRPCED
ncbi:MAG TPA: DUF1850 domain-containing protein [Alphaproteobacteria bacterium]|nr:DUF1850 domain-containing protein [Alphaproteobacteria bacterium]